MQRSGDEAPSAHYLIRIMSWDCDLHLGLSPEVHPKEHRFQGGLLYSRSLTVDGTLLSPEAQRGRTVRISFTVFGPEIEFGPDGLQELGQLYARDGEHRKAEFEAIAILPRDDLALYAICLKSTWRFLHLWTSGDPVERAGITDFAFSTNANAVAEDDVFAG